MKALSLTEPWAFFVAVDEKRFETRDWHTTYRGEIAIAASKGFPRDAREFCHTEPCWSVLRKGGIEIVSLKATGPTQLPLCAIVAVVELADCIATNPEGYEKRLSRVPAVAPAPFEKFFGDYSPGRFAWVTRNLRRLSQPVPVERWEGGQAKVGGALGLYELSPACEAAVREQLAAA